MLDMFPFYKPDKPITLSRLLNGFDDLNEKKALITCEFSEKGNVGKLATATCVQGCQMLDQNGSD